MSGLASDLDEIIVHVGRKLDGIKGALGLPRRGDALSGNDALREDHGGAGGCCPGQERSPAEIEGGMPDHRVVQSRWRGLEHNSVPPWCQIIEILVALT